MLVVFRGFLEIDAVQQFVTVNTVCTRFKLVLRWSSRKLALRFNSYIDYEKKLTSQLIQVVVN